MSHDDELRSRIGRLAETHDVAPLNVDEVMSRRSSTAARQRLLAVAAVLLVVLGVAGIVSVVSGDDDPDVASGDGEGDGAMTDDGSGDEPADLVPTTVPFLTTTTTTFPVGDVVTTTAPPFGGGEWIVPWGDGFLSHRQVWETSAATWEELIPDIRDRFPQEIIDVVLDSGAVDLQSQIAVLEDAGLLEEASAIFQADPELLDAYNQVQSGGSYRNVVERSDGTGTWVEVTGFALPGGSATAQFVQSNGEQLVVVEQVWPADGGTPEILVSFTSDLTTWTTVSLDAAPGAHPDFVEANTWIAGLAVNSDGWYLTVTEEAYVDIWRLIPQSVLDQTGGGGYSLDPTPEGIVVSAWSGGASTTTTSPATTIPATTIPATTSPATTTLAPPLEDEAIAPEPFFPDVDSVVIATVAWSELPLTYADYQTYAEQPAPAHRAFAGPFSGGLSPATPPPVDDCCSVIGTDAGFVAQGWGPSSTELFFSVDGQSWTAVNLPDDVQRLNSLADVEGGIAAIDSAGRVRRAGADGTDWDIVTIDGLPNNANVWFSDAAGRGVVSVMDVAEPVFEQVEIVPYSTAFEHEGFEIEISTAADGSGEVTITDLATGEVVLDEHVDNMSDDDPPPYVDINGGLADFLDGNGDVIVSVPLDVLASAVTTAQGDTSPPTTTVPVYEPDYWLVASSDAITWHVVDLDDAEGRGFGGAAVNGDLVAVRNADGGWETIDLG